MPRGRGGVLLVAVLVLLAIAGIAAGRTRAGRPQPAAAARSPANAQRSASQEPSAPTTSSTADSANPTAPAASGTPTTPAVHIAAVGDVVLGNTPDLPANPVGYLSAVRSALGAPVVFGNLEGTLTDAAYRKCPTASASSSATATPTASRTPPATASPTASGTASPSATPAPPPCFAFRMPPSYGSALRTAGFTVLNSANNHSHDFGMRGVADTTASLRAAKIVQTGLPGQIGVVDENGTRIAFIGFAPYADTNDLLKMQAARQLVTKAKQNADVVVVYMHAGAEGSAAAHVTGKDERYVGEDRGNPEMFADAAIDAGADLVLASGPHVLRGLQYYRGHLIAYSLGNFAGYHNFATSGVLALSAVLEVTLDHSGHLVAARFTSVVLDSTGRPAIDPSGRAATFVNQLSTADFGATAAIIGSAGNLSPPT